MAILVQSYRCRTCEQGATVPHGTAVPEHCGAPMRWVRTQTWTPPPRKFGRAPALDFAPSRDREVPLEDPRTGGPLYMESLHQLRQIERESERREADGEGQALRFRMYSQDASNRHTNTYGASPQRTPSQAWLRKHGAKLREALESPDEAGELGPGMTEAGMSALPEAP